MALGELLCNLERNCTPTSPFDQPWMTPDHGGYIAARVTFWVKNHRTVRFPRVGAQPTDSMAGGFHVLGPVLFPGLRRVVHDPTLRW